MRIIKKISKGFLKTILFLAFILALGYTILRSDPFQNWAAKKAVTWLAGELKTKVSLRSIHFELLNTLVLEDLYVEDQKGDTLAFFKKLHARFDYRILFDTRIQLARLSHVTLERSKFYMVMYPGEEYYNYQFIVDYFTVTGPPTGEFVPFKLFINEVKLKDVTYRLRDMTSEPASGRRFDESNMEFRHIIGTIAPFRLIGDSLDLGVKDLSFTERSGLRVNQFTARTIVSYTTIECSDMILRTPYSKLGNYLKFSYTGWRDFASFEDSVKWDVNMAGTLVNTRDIACFTDELNGYVIPIRINGKVTGTLGRLRSKNLDLVVGKLNTFKGAAVVRHVSDPDNTWFDLDISELYVNPSSLGQLTGTKLPDELLRIGSVKYTGTLTGGYQDLTTHGVTETTIGRIRSDFNLKLPDKHPEIYKGSFELFAFDLGKLLNRKDLGPVSMQADIDGEGFTMKDLKTTLNGQIYSIFYDNYTYTNVDVDGRFDKKRFDGKLNLADPNINLSFNGNLDFNGKDATGSFKSTVGLVNLKNLGYGDINIVRLSELTLDFEGLDPDEMNIRADLNNLVLEKKGYNYFLGNLDLDISGSSERRSLSLTSLLGNVTLNGHYRLSHLNYISNNLLYHLFPDYFSHLKGRIEPTDVRFDVDIKDSKYISSLFVPELSFEGFTASGVYNSTDQNLDLIARADYMRYGKFRVNEIKTEGNKQPGQRLILGITSRDLRYDDSLITENIQMDANIGGNDFNVRIRVADTSRDVSLASTVSVHLSKESTDISLKETRIFMYSDFYELNESNHIRLAGDQISVDSLILLNGQQSIAVNGGIDNGEFHRMNVKIRQLELPALNPLFARWDFALEGLTNGDFLLNGKIDKPTLISDLNVIGFALNNDSIGDLDMHTSLKDPSGAMLVSGTIHNGLINDLMVSGELNLASDKPSMDIQLDLKESSIRPFEMFTEGLFSGVDGIANASVSIKGPLGKPEISGTADVRSARVFMDYLGLPLKVNKMHIYLDEKVINLGSFNVIDQKGNECHAGGRIYHRNFSDFKYDIYVKDLKNFNCMNLTEDKADMFFGTAYVDGQMTVTGPADALDLKIKAKTRPNTTISLPLEGTSENVGPDFIEVVDLRADLSSKEEKKLSGITMDFDFEVTEDAVIELIFDAKFNDVIRATGNGNIRMELNTFGDFYMYGNYEIETGSYNFTALNNLINKKLNVKKGGKIMWNGNPTDALLDLVAVTTVNADPRVIMPGLSTASNISSNVPIDCEIFMKDKLFEPQIRLDIDLSTDKKSTMFASNDISNAINLIKSDQEETNKQFISLLVFNSFAPLNSLSTSAASASNISSSLQNSLGEFMSSQLNNWLSQIDPNWELGLDLVTADRNSNTNQQVIVSLKRKLLNDRIEIGGTYGQAGNTSYDVNISYKVTKDGRLLVRGFNRKANDPMSGSTSSATINTSGLGLYYRREIDYFFPNLRKKLYDKKHR